MARPLSIDTLGDIADAEAYRLFAHCVAPGCRRHVPLDLATLIAAHGRALTLVELRRRLRCARCGGARVGITIGWDLPKAAAPPSRSGPR